jgi:carbon starvation protein
MRSLMAYWYHFAIMFEAVFILTTIDSGTRIGRFLLQEFVGRVYKPFGRADFFPASLAATILIVASWSYFIWTGEISTIWPMFGVANQLLAVVALAVATTLVINIGRAKYAWVTALPCLFVTVTTLAAGYLNIVDIFWPMVVGPNPDLHVQGWVNTICTVIMLVSAVIILVATSRRSLQVLSGRAAPVLEVAEA